MRRCKGFIILVAILIFIGFIPDIYAQRSYRREFPASVSPKPESIQERDARKQMEREVQKEKEQELLEAQPKELIPTKEKAKLVSPKPTQVYYRISVGDKLYISVWRVADLSLEFIVGPDGYISFPLIGDVFAYGKTLSELDAEITEDLKEYVVQPQVSVMVREFAGDKVTVLGEIRSPGIYKFVRQTNIIDVIAQAGGFTNKAKVVGVVIIREPGDPKREPDLIVINTKEILKGKFRNFEVEPNDIVYISPTFVSNLKEFYNNWIAPVLGTVAGTAIDYETFMALRRARRQ